MKHALAIAAALAISSPSIGAANAEGFDSVRNKTDFVGLVSGRALTRFGITLNVSAEGAIEGRAFGQPVTGSWKWQDGLFCRDLYFGSTDLGPNCQVVQKKGDTLRFISDAGAGDHADLRLK
jgi:hypothetical protein